MNTEINTEQLDALEERARRAMGKAALLAAYEALPDMTSAEYEKTPPTDRLAAIMRAISAAKMAENECRKTTEYAMLREHERYPRIVTEHVVATAILCSTDNLDIEDDPSPECVGSLFILEFAVVVSMLRSLANAISDVELYTDAGDLYLDDAADDMLPLLVKHTMASPE